ncbi:hypothetical protein BJX61DRAFT_540260 [Aspergillus egyptiacus]|nr:hypothetical protein BJX61DRAFT_540260 [Aspergillus egyptiacus]
MPTPVAKGIVIGVAALVAAGIAVYESPQFRRWVNNSRRKVAIALHNLGDGVHPNETYQSDISMMEETGPAAEERRRIAREEIQRRRSVLEERQKKRSNSSLTTFDSLVDDNGHLLGTRGETNTVASSTGMDLGASQPVQRGKPGVPTAESSVVYEAPALEKASLQLSIPDQRSRSSSVTGADFTTPVSEVSDDMSALMVSQPSVEDQRVQSSLSSHTEGNFSEVFYSQANSVASGAAQEARSPFSDLEGLRFTEDRPTTPETLSTADNFSHIEVEASSDGTLSEFDGSLGRATPASWSEVGSEVGSEEDHQGH